MKINEFFTESDDEDLEKAFSSYLKSKDLEKLKKQKLSKSSPFIKGFVKGRETVKKIKDHPVSQASRRLWRGQIFTK